MSAYSLDGNGIYPKAYVNLMSGNISLFSVVAEGELKASLVDNTYSPVSTDEFFDTVVDSGEIATNGTIALTGSVLHFQTQTDTEPMQGGYLSSSATVFESVGLSANAGTVGRIVIYVDGDNPGTNDYLIGIFMRDNFSTDIEITPDGDNITINWDESVNRFLGCIFSWGFGDC